MSLGILAFPSFPIFNTPLKQFLSLFLQVLITLRLFGQEELLVRGGWPAWSLYSIGVKDITFVCPALCRQLNNINFPTTADEPRRVKDVFYKIAHFPNVVGAIDGTRIPIQGMSGNDEPNNYFTCRKGYPSIHVYNY